jgi:hypothetical protein
MPLKRTLAVAGLEQKPPNIPYGMPVSAALFRRPTKCFQDSVVGNQDGRTAQAGAAAMQ